MVKTISKSEILFKYKEAVKYHGRIMKKDILFKSNKLGIPSIPTIIKYFGSTDELEKQSGIKFIRTKRNNKRWTKKEILLYLNKIINKKHITKGQIIDLFNNDKNLCGIITARKMFGSTENIIIALDLKLYPIKINDKKVKRRNYRNRLDKMTKFEVIKLAKKYNKKYGNMPKTEWRQLCRREQFVSGGFIVKRFGSMDNFAKEVGIDFKIPKKCDGWAIGKYEKSILDKIQKEKDIFLIRQYPVYVDGDSYLIDGYDPINNVAYEVDEQYHNQKEYSDFVRQTKIENKLRCTFVRIPISYA